ncbi:PPE domain-containing protein [Mycolicibacterium moriokaense]|uniref:PPE family protein n=1 Tax=Mycolicibacterium moriokaense TaxID=39691 RepID=A0A318H866_9MYCO|nr:PPE domain-containing protein [Mycolicibacterium moriokaense]PXX01545.1 PPE family protein [Mycolicibacterium moriokaense]
MIQVDPSGLAGAAQRIADVLAELMGGDPAHPPLGADPASAGAAARLSTAGASLVAVIGEQALGLAATAAQLLNVSTTFDAQDLYNKSGLEKLGVPDMVGATGWAPPSPPIPPDVRPPLTPPPPLPAEVLATAVHSGDPNAGEAFISAWRQLVSALEGAADTVRSVGAQLPEQWDSPVSTDAVRDHLDRYAQALDTSASRAQTLAWQAGRHGEQNTQARNDIPPPQQFEQLRQQIQTVSAANIASGGKYATQLTQLMGEKTALDTKAAQGYNAFHSETESTTAGDGEATDGAAGTSGVPGDPAAGAGKDPRQPGPGDSAEQMSPEKAGQLASMLPQLIPTLLGAAGGLVGGLMKAPETLMQAGSQMAGQVSQELGGLMKSGLDADKLEKASRSVDSGLGAGKGLGAGGGGGGTMPAGGGPASTPPAVTPTTGPPPNLPSMPSGGLPQPVSSAGASSGTMPMGMPMGGLAGAGHGAGAGGQGGQEPPQRTKKVVTPPEPHTESVTGKANADRIAFSAGASAGRGPEPPDDDPPQSPRPVVRRITMPSRDDEL